jgi:hypothetical protein
MQTVPDTSGLAEFRDAQWFIGNIKVTHGLYKPSTLPMNYDGNGSGSASFPPNVPGWDT